MDKGALIKLGCLGSVENPKRGRELAWQPINKFCRRKTWKELQKI